jgi:type IV pilus assembly protein PilV
MINGRHSHERGFSLIELLVAVVIFSVGMLAVAGLQTVSKRANFEGLQRATATQVANGLLEDMRTNGDAMATYLAAGELGGGVVGSEPAPTCKGASVCNSVQKAAHDLWFWEGVLDGDQVVNANGSVGGIVTPTICINGPAGAGAGVYTVTIAWYGTVAMTDSGASLCGAASGKYDPNNQNRRLVQIPTYIDPTF